MYGLKDKVAYVTGAAMGNGLGITEALAKHGSKVIMVDINNEVFKAAKRMKDDGFDVFAIKADVTKISEIQDSVKESIEIYKKIDILVNNAGVAKLKKFINMTNELRDFHFDVNLFGVWDCCKVIVPFMIRQKYGKIIMISSVTGPYVSDFGLSAYGTTKAALIGLTKSLALELAEFNINVNAICPGYIDTPSTYNTALQVDKNNPEKVIRNIIKNIPIGRVGKPSDIGELVSFLASENSSFITGSSIIVDGGTMLPETKAIVGL